MKTRYYAQKKALILTDSKETTNRKQRNDSFKNFLEKNGIKVDIYSVKASNIFNIIRTKYDYCISQNRPRRNIIALPFIKSNSKILELRDPIIYRNRNFFSYLINLVLSIYAKLFSKKILARKNLGMSEIEKKILGKKLKVTRDYGVAKPGNIKNFLKIKKQGDCLNALYAGNIYSEIYMESINSLAETHNVIVYILGDNTEYHNKFITYIGKISRKELAESYQLFDASIVINDSKKYDYIPSKFTEVVSFSNSIIYLTSNTEDKISKIINKNKIGIVIDINFPKKLTKNQIDLLKKHPNKNSNISNKYKYFFSEEKYFEQIFREMDR